MASRPGAQDLLRWAVKPAAGRSGGSPLPGGSTDGSAISSVPRFPARSCSPARELSCVDEAWTGAGEWRWQSLQARGRWLDPSCAHSGQRHISMLLSTVSVPVREPAVKGQVTVPGAARTAGCSSDIGAQNGGSARSRVHRHLTAWPAQIGGYLKSVCNKSWWEGGFASWTCSRRRLCVRSKTKKRHREGDRSRSGGRHHIGYFVDTA